MFAMMRELDQNGEEIRMVQWWACVCFPTNTVPEPEPTLIQGTKKPFCEPANISTDLRPELLEM